MHFNLDAYLERIGLTVAPEADAGGLAILHRAHRLAVPFENLDILLGRGISLLPDDVFDKIVVRRRGGYCFEQNGLFLRALCALGFEARPLLARVWLGAIETPPKTHTLNLVTLDGLDWIADAGFGGSLTPPMRLIEQEVQSWDGASHRLAQDPLHGWMLERRGNRDLTDGRGAGTEWERQYSFTLEEVWPSDLALSNHFTATLPGGLFTSNAVVSIVLPNGFASLFNRDYSRASASGSEKSEIASAKAFRIRLSLMFGIDLTADEVAMLGLFAA